MIPILFLVVCIPLRVGFVVGSFFLERSSVTKIPFVVLSFVAASGFFMSNVNSEIVKRGKVVRGFAGGVKYWNSLAHGFFYASYGTLLLLNTEFAFVVLGADFLFGLVTVLEHYLTGDMERNTLEMT